jgi:hypothetical protein
LADERAERRRQGSRRTQARHERRDRAQHRRSRRTLILSFGGGGIAFLLVVSLFLPSLNLFGSNSPSTDSSNDRGTFVAATLPATHIPIGSARPEYNTNPPTSGPHYDIPAPWGVHTAHLQDEALVHNLEHGGVIVNYNLSSVDQIMAIQAVLMGKPNFPGCFIIQPDDTIAQGVVVLTAWQWIEEFAPNDITGMEQFIDGHVNRGPEFLGADCGPTAAIKF